jgi:hypothetical protein
VTPRPSRLLSLLPVAAVVLPARPDAPSRLKAAGGDPGAAAPWLDGRGPPDHGVVALADAWRTRAADLGG